MPFRIDCFEFVAFAFGIRRRFGLPSGQPNGYGYCAQGRNTPPLFRLLRPLGAIRLHGRAMCSGASALARIRTAFFSMATMPETMAPKLDRHNERSFNPNPMIAGASSPRQRRVMNELPSILSPLVHGGE